MARCHSYRAAGTAPKGAVVEWDVDTKRSPELARLLSGLDEGDAKL